jgi:hypothetical protein
MPAMLSRRRSAFQQVVPQAAGIDWKQFIHSALFYGGKAGPGGKRLGDYAYLTLLPVAGAALAPLAGYGPNENTQVERLMDGVFRFFWLHAPTMSSYGGEPDKADAAAQIAPMMAMHLGFTKGSVNRALKRLYPIWQQLVLSSKR